MKMRMTSSLGSLASGISSYAETVDLILIGTERRGNSKKMLLDSTASSVLLSAPCIVMVVR